MATPGLLGWHADGELFRIDEGGAVARSRDGRQQWEVTGRIDGAPAAVAAEGDGLYAALHDGTIVISTDGGRTWRIRLPRPRSTSTIPG